MDTRAGGSDGQKVPSATANKAETRGRHGARREQGAKKGGRRGWERAEPLGVGGNSGGCEASGVDPEPHEVGGEEGDREASGVEENPGGGATEWERGGQIFSGRIYLPRRGRGGRIVPGRLDPQRKGQGS